MRGTRDPGSVAQARPRKTAKGHDVRAPSHSSDTGADPVTEGAPDDTNDHNHTRQRTAGGERRRSDHDIGTDRVVGSEEAGLGREPDEVEETRP